MLGVVLNAGVAIIVALLGYKQTAKEKNDEEYRKLREDLEKEREENSLREKKKHEERLNSIEKSIKTLNTEVVDLKNSVDTLTNDQVAEFQNQLRNLHKMESNNFEYIHSLSNVVINIGQTIQSTPIVDDKYGEKLEECIEDHQKVETDIHKQLYSMIM